MFIVPSGTRALLVPGASAVGRAQPDGLEAKVGAGRKMEGGRLEAPGVGRAGTLLYTHARTAHTHQGSFYFRTR